MECRDSCMEKVCRAKGTEKAERFPVKEEGMETEDEKEEEHESQEDATQEACPPGFYNKVDKEIHYYAGHEISIWKSTDAYSATVWPAALALCQYLDTNQRAVNLLDKAVLEIGAGTGLVSIVASLLGAWVTASDLPEVLDNLRGNLSRNTRGHCRYTPQVAELTWGYKLKHIFPRSIYRYDYVLAADVVYNHNFLAELLETMCHFCQPGTTLIWSNQVFASDLAFLESFKEVFNTTLLADLGEIKIYSATTKEFKRKLSVILSEDAGEEEEKKEEKEEGNTEENLREVSRRNKPGKKCERQELDTCASVTENSITGKNKKDQEQVLRGNIDVEGTLGRNDKNCQVEPKDEDEGSSLESEKDEKPESHDCNAQLAPQRSWEPSVCYRLDKEIHYFMGHTITIQESIDSYGGMIWPAAVALYKFLETTAGREQIKLMDKETLELGAGTGLLSVAAVLLGAKLTATDLPELLSNLRYNLNRNTRGHRRHEPQVAALSWGHELEKSFPRSEFHFDYVLAADVVYHHSFLDELLATMHYLCQPGTNLIWANKIRYPSDRVFIENFKKTFHATLIAELDDVRIYLGTFRAPGEEDHLMKSVNQEEEKEEENNDWDNDKRNEKEELKRHKHSEAKEESESLQNHADYPTGENKQTEKDNSRIHVGIQIDSKKRQDEAFTLQQKKQDGEHEPQKEEDDQEENTIDRNTEDAGKEEESQACNETCLAHTEERSVVADRLETNESVYRKAWEPNIYFMPGKEIHYFLGEKITIEESFDSYGAMIWPAAVALCKFLETPAGLKQINLLDKSVLEIGAGTGLLSIVATLLGAKLTATDLPEVLSNLRYNLNRNTRRLRRHEPQIKELSWGHKLEETFPHSTHHYDYVLAADVVYHHSFLDELLVTMQHFCQPGTNLIWANKVRYPSDLVFIENFKKVFHATLIAELDEVRIYLGTHRAPGEEEPLMKSLNQEEAMEEQNNDWKDGKKELNIQEYEVGKEESETRENHGDEQNPAGERTENKKGYNSCIDEDIDTDTKKRQSEAVMLQQTEEEEEHEPQNDKNSQEENEGEREPEETRKDEESQACSESKPTSSAHTEERSVDADRLETEGESVYRKAWEPNVYFMPGKEIHYFLGEKISIEESFDSYGAMIWPAAVALCKFLETPAGLKQINLLDKSVLEIGAGTGLLSIAATLLGAKLTATDLPEVLSNLRYNLNRNTRRLRRHEPQIKELSWGHKLEETFPHSTHHYDYVLAADVVYHHSFLDELLVTMQHFCQPGTNLIWANKVRYPSDLVFIENFKKVFHATLIAELDEVRIYRGTHKCVVESNVLNKEEEEGDEEEEKREEEDEKEDKNEAYMMEQEAEEDHHGEPQDRGGQQPSTVHISKVCTGEQLSKETYYFVGHEISIEESSDFHGGLGRPAALGLCKFLDTTAGRQKFRLVNKSVLELGAGHGVVSTVATLLGAKVTATDMPEILGGLRNNLNQNTRHSRRYEPQVAPLSWGQDLEYTFPHSEFHFDYVLAADVVYNHDFLDELLVTMRYFCRPGTTLIWANEVRNSSDLDFTENFKKAFHATLVAELDEVKIYSATTKECGNMKDLVEAVSEEAIKKSVFNTTLFKDLNEGIHKEENLERPHPSVDNEMARNPEERKDDVQHEVNIMKPHGGEMKAEGQPEETEAIKGSSETQKNMGKQKRGHTESEQGMTDEDEEDEEETLWKTEVKGSTGRKSSGHKEASSATDRKLCEERHFFAGHEIRITDSLEPYGPTVRPAAVALCKFLETNTQQINLKSKAVLELGAGTGLVSVVASLLGAWVTATDKAVVLDNLSSNLSRNTRGLSKHTPQVEALSWKDHLSRSFPRSTFCYDIVLAADMVYQHDLLDELLAAMRHFCQPGTALIWANTIRTQTETTFSERFQRAFAATLLAEMGEVKIYMAKTHSQRWT